MVRGPWAVIVLREPRILVRTTGCGLRITAKDLADGLRGYVEPLGGRLSLIAEFPNQERVILSGIAALDGDTVAGAHKS